MEEKVKTPTRKRPDHAQGSDTKKPTATAESGAIAGLEFLEDFYGKRKERKASGYTRRSRMADKLKALELYGKAMAS